MKKSLLYVVPCLNYFNTGYRGKVMHALGICEGYYENSWDVTIIGGEGLKKFEIDLPSNINIIELVEPKNIFKYPIWWLKLILVFLKLTNSNKYDCFITRYAVSSFIPLAFFSIFSKKNTHRIIEVNSFAYHMLSNLPRILNNLVAQIEMKLMNLFDLVYVVSETMVVDERNYNCKTKIKCIPNGATSKKILFSDPTNTIQNVRLVYFGTLMPYWDFDYLVKSINYLHLHLDIEILFLGDGPEFDFLKNNIVKKDLCMFHGRFSRNELGSLLKPKSDILLLPPKTKVDMLLSGGLSTKLFDYLSMRMPIFAPSDKEIKGVLLHNKNSILYNSDSVEDFYDKLKTFYNDDFIKLNISDGAYRDFLCKYSWKARMECLIGELDG